MPRKPVLKEKVEARLAAQGDGCALLTREFLDLGSERQVFRILQNMVQEGRLVRLGYGVYGRTRISRLSGEPVLAGDLVSVGREVLNKLGIRWDLTDAQRAYNERRSTQVPVNPAIRVVGSRFSRKLREGKWELRLDR
jgi:hypothetical protein